MDNKLHQESPRAKLNPERPNQGAHLYSSLTFIDSEKRIHKREVYNFLDFIGDIGGVLEAIIFVFGIFLFPASEQMFTYKMAQEVFMACTNIPFEYNLRSQNCDASAHSLKFGKQTRGKKKQRIDKFIQDLDPLKRKEIAAHHIIKISYFDTIKLYLKK